MITQIKVKITQIKTSLIVLSLVLLLSGFAEASIGKSCSLLKAYCASDVLTKALQNLGVDPGRRDKAVDELNKSADAHKGYNSLYEIKLAAQKAGLKAKAIKTGRDTLRLLTKQGQLIANITGNRHFCLIKEITDEGVSVYIPGLNYENPTVPLSEFQEHWENNIVLLISKKAINLNLEPIPDQVLKGIQGGQPCSNCTGGGGTYSGSGGEGRWTSGNEPGQSNSDSSDARTDPATIEPVVIRNGNLFLNIDDIALPTRGLALNLKRHYNSQVVSEVPGWIPEPGAGTWVIEQGEYSGQGDRTTSDTKFADFTLELDMQTVQPGPSYSWETGWLNFRYLESVTDPRKAKDCYYFLMHTNGKIELSKWKDGAQYWLYNKLTLYKPTNKNHIKIEAYGANIKIYINGSLEINYTDANPVLAGGRIALESYYSHAHFDNIAITAGVNTYNYDFNSDDNEFIFGYGWTHSYSLRLKEYANHVTLYRENNHKELYVPQGDGSYLSVPVNYYSKLSKDSSGFSLKDKYGSHYRFNLQGFLQYIEDRNLNRTSLAYAILQGKTLLSSITEPSGRAISLEYGTNNMVSKAFDPQGNFIQYFYSPDNQLTQVIDRNGNAANYAYDPITHNLTQLTDPEGNIFKYNYTYNDRVNDQQDPLGQATTFDYLWSTVHVINKRGELYKYNFDPNEFLQSITDPQNFIERTTNDPNGNILSHNDKNNNLTSFTYDSQGNRKSITDAKAGLSSFTYEPSFNQLASIIDAKGNVTTFTYDSQGNLIQTANPEGGITTYTYNLYGQLASITDPKGNTTSFTYDPYGNLAAKTDALANTTTYTYDILGRLNSTTDALGNITQNSYDNNGNLILIKDPQGNLTAYTYTKNGLLASTTDPLGNTTTYAYDPFGNLSSVTDASGSITSYTYDTANQMHLNRANLLSISDAKANTTTYSYDSLDRRTKTTDAQANFYQLTYDHQGNLISRLDSNLKTTSYQYDGLNRLVKIIYPDATSVSYTLDTLGNLIQMQDATGITLYTYDKLNRLTSLTYPDTTVLSYAYDLNHNRSALQMTGLGSILYTYDSLNRLISLSSPDGKVTSFTYDALSRRTKLSYPNGVITSYSYDSLSRLTGLLTQNSQLLTHNSFTYAYDNSSRRIRVDTLNDSIYYSYDKVSQLIQESSPGYSIAYTYDQTGNRLTQLEDGSTTAYTYNNLNQLTQSQGTLQKLILVKGTVSGTGTLTVKVNSITANVTGSSWMANNIPINSGLNTIAAEVTDSFLNLVTNQISVTYNPTTPAITYTYDKNGNLIQQAQGTQITQYSYDFENRLKAYTSPAQTASYAYNGQGKRISKTVNSATTKYYYDGDELIAEKTGASPIYYLHSPRIDEIISDSRGYYYHSDGLGSVVSLTDFAGTKATDYTYKAFGGMRSQSGSIFNPWLFTGRQFDAESNIYFYRNRYYDPRIGRFITTDKFPFNKSRPLSLNKYIYCENNPVNYTDPNGETPWLLIYLGNAIKRGVVSGLQAGAGTATVSFITGIARGSAPIEIAKTSGIGFIRGFTSGFIGGTLSGLGVPTPAARTFAGTATGFIYGNPAGGLAGGLASGLSGLASPFMASTVGSTVGEIFSPVDVGRGSEISILSDAFKDYLNSMLNEQIGESFGRGINQGK